MLKKIIYSKEKIKLLEAAVSTGLPIIITGKVGSGKTSLCNFLRDSYGKPALDIGEYILASFMKPDLKTFIDENSNKGLIIVEEYNSKVETHKLFDEFINIKCFKGDENGSYYIHIVLSKPDQTSVINGVSENMPFIILKGSDSTRVKQRYISDNNIQTTHITTVEGIKALAEIVRGRYNEIKLYRAGKWQFIGVKELHFTINLNDMNEYLNISGEDGLLFLDYLITTGIFITCYTEEINVEIPNKLARKASKILHI